MGESTGIPWRLVLRTGTAEHLLDCAVVCEHLLDCATATADMRDAVARSGALLVSLL